MRYLFLIYSRESDESLPEEWWEKVRAGHRAVMEESHQKGALLGAERLKSTATAKTVRSADGDSGPAMVTDGPFAETKEQLAGYYMMECRDMDEALEWAKKIPTGCKGGLGCIEVRPVDELPRRS